ncbi:unnamed protein product [Nippostrongylus brasiliensis]|uniref:GDP-mannose transporter n=1 Tax=Nippostrongylus brasiliensis TaxID=27835 RepID=A0A0N4YSR5_NIPBR|nr:unnamed protein product [Nippostrongylus brasiliensis]
MEEGILWRRILSAVFYGVTSIVVVFVNKILLTNFRFPSFLFVGFGQMVATVAVLFVARTLRIVSFPAFDSTIPRKIMPLPLLFVLNLVSGLGGTKLINSALWGERSIFFQNLFVTYAGMFSSGDYVFQWTNFIGINVSVMGSMLYTYVTFRAKSVSQRNIVVAPASKAEMLPLI